MHGGSADTHGNRPTQSRLFIHVLLLIIITLPYFLLLETLLHIYIRVFVLIVRLV